MAPLDPADPVRLGPYAVTGRLGTGGQGVVYLGRGDDGRQVAIKLLHAQLLGDRNARARFVRELALLQRVAGFCTAKMLDADVAGDRPYIVSEFVPGPSLRELVQTHGPRTGADLDRLAISTVTALTAIHRAGIVHRDFKPQNVLVGPDGPRVIDFGIARALDSGATVTSQVVGTPVYMAPEQFSAAPIGPSADLHAWAATLLFAATGTDPFAGGPLPAVMYRILHETPDLSALPPQIAEVAAACLAKDPQSRPSAEETLLWLLGDRAQPAPTDRSDHPRAYNPPGAASAYGQASESAQPDAHDPRGAYDQPGGHGRADAYGAPGAHDARGSYAPPNQPGTSDQPGPPDPPTPPGVYSPPGAHGSAGAPGQPGASGPPGVYGWPDAYGPPGASAPPGVDGSPGEFGSHVAADASAQPGASGSPGVYGAPAQPGVSGQAGAHGSVGAPGQPGPPGASAPPGVYGWPGAHGSAGVSGQPGAHGSAGVSGPPGAPGPAGVYDSAGVYGQSGAIGAFGRPGASSLARGYRVLRRSPVVVLGLVLAALLAVLDIVVLAALVARPGLSSGPRGELLPAASSYGVLAMVTLVAVVMAWRGSRAAAWTVLVVRVLRVVAWVGWSFVVAVDPAFGVYGAVSLVAAVLLAIGLYSR
ncbi:protein kinase [Actinomadura fulvescens]